MAFSHNQPSLNELGNLWYRLLVIVKSFLLLLIHIFFCYATIYLLLPNYLSKKKYLHLVVGLLTLCTLTIPTGYFLYSLVYPFIDKLFNLHLAKPKTIVWASIDASLMNAIKVTIISTAIT